MRETKKSSWCQLGLWTSWHKKTHTPEVIDNITVLYKSKTANSKKRITKHHPEANKKWAEKNKKLLSWGCQLKKKACLVQICPTTVEDMYHQYHFLSNKSFQVPNHSRNKKILPNTIPTHTTKLTHFSGLPHIPKTSITAYNHRSHSSRLDYSTFTLYLCPTQNSSISPSQFSQQK